VRTTLWLDLRRPVDELLALAALAEAAGWDAVRVSDQTGADHPMGSRPPAHECWAVIAALAATVARVRLQVVVEDARGRHPAVVAKLASTADQLSRGRLLLGLTTSTGSRPEPAATADAVSRLSEQAEVIRALSSGGPVTFRGRFYRLDQAPLDPPTWQQPFPLMLVGGSAAVAAAWADQWEVAGPLDRATEQVAALDGAARSRLTISAAAVGAEHPAAWARIGVSDLVVPDAALGNDPGAWPGALHRLRSAAVASDQPG
jgi:alkanesulfonate monooxygenase SsuD/methylene tetrahydromethanopterin reductase-like flavin-dependent oxidoreductase (luciferase family)